MSDDTGKNSSKQKGKAKSVDFALPPGKRATSYDVARLAGVSQSAVSRCYKPGASVSKKMRARVVAAAEELGWQPNAIARGLVTRRSNLVAIFAYSGATFYYPEVLFSLSERLAEDNLNVLLFGAETPESVDGFMDQIAQYQVDGVIVASNLTTDQAVTLQSRNIPVIMFNRYLDDLSTDIVLCDPKSQIQGLVADLIGLGHTRFAIVRGPASSMIGQLRVQRMREALTEHGLEVAAETEGDYSFESGVQAMQQLAQHSDAPPTAILCANDMMALGLMDEARDVLGLRIPEDISVVGIDGIGTARLGSYDLTTIRQPIKRMSDAAVSLLLAQIENAELSHEKRVFDGMTIEGNTTGPAPGSVS